MGKVIKSGFMVLFLVFVVKINAVLAVGSAFFNRTGGAAPGIDVLSTDTLPSAVTNVINYFLGILGFIAVAFIIYAGILMVTDAGGEEGVGKAKKIITYAVVGLVVIILSYTIVSFVTSIPTT